MNEGFAERVGAIGRGFSREEARRELTDPRRRPSRAREPVAQHIVNCVPDTLLVLDEVVFAKNVRSARNGVRNDSTVGQSKGHTHVVWGWQSSSGFGT